MSNCIICTSPESDANKKVEFKCCQQANIWVHVECMNRWYSNNEKKCPHCKRDIVIQRTEQNSKKINCDLCLCCNDKLKIVFSVIIMVTNFLTTIAFFCYH